MIETDDDMIEIDTEEDLIMAKKFISNM